MKLKQIDLYNYLLQAAPDELVYESKKRIHLKSHNSLIIQPQKKFWYYFSHDFGGSSAFDYLTKVEGYKKSDAYNELKKIDQSKLVTYEYHPKSYSLSLPGKSQNYDVIYNYLCKQRGISKEVLASYILQDLIYLDEQEKNIIFVGKDEDHHPRFACSRSINGKERKDLTGSQKKYSFHKEGTTSTLHIFESAIDLLSYQTLQYYCFMPLEDHYLSLTGLGNQPLEHYLKKHSISTLIFHLDSDAAGKEAYHKFYKIYHEHYIIQNKSINEVKDINEYLCTQLKQIHLQL